MQDRSTLMSARLNANFVSAFFSIKFERTVGHSINVIVDLGRPLVEGRMWYLVQLTLT